ncbi:TetR/AcrR family transcriptional regulator [Edwardsiella tarda]|uniref:TetR/AcrR family transcriptional regulator n=1 Tax=Edwardsiella tarda TaxID=636 RepID=UPI00351C5553
MARPLQHDRDEALQQAVILFWRQGYFATSMKDIERALNMRPGSIYASFGSKEALFTRALACYTQRQIADYEALIIAYGDPFAATADFLQQFGQPTPASTPSAVCFLVKSLLELEGQQDDSLALQVRLHLAAMEAAFYRAFLPVLTEPQARQVAQWLQKEVIGIRIMASQLGDSPALARLVAESVKTLQRWPRSDS